MFKKNYSVATLGHTLPSAISKPAIVIVTSFSLSRNARASYSHDIIFIVTSFATVSVTDECMLCTDTLPRLVYKGNRFVLYEMYYTDNRFYGCRFLLEISLYARLCIAATEENDSLFGQQSC